jgi:hypothetical protein
MSTADIAFVAASLVVILAARRWVLLYALLVLPGTVLHELAHWSVGLLTGARPEALRLVPVRRPKSKTWTLGAVALRRIHWLNALPVALAPILLLPIALGLYALALAADAGTWQHWAGLYAATVAMVSCLPSPADWRLAMSRPGGAVLYLLLGAGAAAVWWW